MDEPIHILEQVGLPPPESVCLSDRTLRDEYAQFCNGVEVVVEGQALRTDSQFFVFSFSDDDLHARDNAKLRLLAALIRPGQQQLEDIRERTHLVDNVDRSRGQFSGHLYELGVAAALREFEQFLVTDDYRGLTANTTACRRISSISAELSTAPGITWFSQVDVIDYDNRWALVLHYSDAEDDQFMAFPQVLGFAEKEDLARSVGWILATEPNLGMADSALFWGDDLLAACWSRHGDDLGISYGPIFLNLSEPNLQALWHDYGSLHSSALAEDLDELWRLGIDLLELEHKEPADLVGKVLDRFGRPRNPGHIKRLIRRLKIVEELREQQELEQFRIEQAERKARAEARYKATPIRSPDDLPVDMRVDDLTADEMLSLTKWMQEVLGLRNPSVTYQEARKWGHSMGYHYFQICFEGDQGREMRTFRTTEGLPTVKRAFEEALGSI